MLNVYENRLTAFVQQQKDLDLLDTQSRWGDFKLHSKFRYGFEFAKTYPLKQRGHKKWIVGRSAANLSPLPVYYSDIAKAFWVLAVAKFQHNAKSVSVRAVIVRHILSILAHEQKQLCAIATNDWAKFVEFCAKYASPVKQALYGIEFMEQLQEYELIPANLKFTHPFSHAQSLEKTLREKKKRIPSNDTVMAIGNIFDQKMPKVGEAFDVYENQCEKFALALLSLSFAAPCRAAAELFLLRNQDLQAKSITTADGETKTVFSLNWVGSKKFKDHRKHIWDQMAPAVERSLYFFNKVAEPARVMARFYENPLSPLQDLLAGTAINIPHHIPAKSSVSIWQLGDILGFYDSYTEVNKKHLATIAGFPFNVDNTKKLNHFQLTALFNAVYVANSNGYRIDNSGIAHFPNELGREHTLATLQSAWIDYMYLKNPQFPYRKKSNGKSVKLSNALIVLLGSQLHSNRFRFANKCFALTPAELSAPYSLALKSLFIDNGFDSSYSITPHQPRHYINTLCQDAGLGQELIAYFSGRAKVTHNIHYDHSDDNEKHFRTSMLHGEKSRDITVITAEQYTELTGRAAADMGVGLCTQDLYQNPCTYLSDFEANCIGCPSSAYCKGDKQAIDLMKRDLAIQEQRLKSAPLQMELSKNILSARWFKLHSNKVSVYKALIELMEDESIPDGSIIRFTEQRDQFAVIDLHDKTRIIRTVQLPAPDAALNAKLIEEKAQASDEKEPTKLNQLLESFGL